MFGALVRHFFGRFFDNEFVAQNTEMQVTVTKLLALLSSPGIIMPCLQYLEYLSLDYMPREMRNPALWSDRTLYLSFSMLIMGAVTVLEWDALFPDRRDYVSLMPLPIPARTIFLSKIAALALFMIAFTVSVNAVSTVAFPAVSYRGAFPGLLRAMAAQGISIFASNAFVFLFLVALEGVLLNILSVRWFRKISAYVQGAMVFALLWLFFLFPDISISVARLKAHNPAVLFAFPPAWFLGLNEVLLGSRDAVFVALAHRAEMWLSVAVIVAALSYTVAYRRHVRRTLESTEGSDSTRTAIHEWIGRIADLVAPDAVERATVAFIGKTLARSAKHRVFLAVYAGVGCALAAQVFSAAKIHDQWLSLPLVVGFFVLSGMRFIFTIPCELPANWLFRVSDTNHQRAALNGTRTAMRWFAVAPLFLGLLPVYFVLWSPAIALANFLFSVTISLILIEALTMEFRKIPFTCSYPPGKANISIMWGAYWAGFLVYAFSMASLESWMVKRPLRLIPFYLIVAIIFGGFEWWRRRADSVGVALVFDDAADPVILTLGLGELAWTRTATSRGDTALRRPSSSRVSRVE
jgi:hypothetical protein